MTPATLRDEMSSMSPAMHGPAPERYAAISRWWELHAQESRNPSECLLYAENQKRLYLDMLHRPSHYRAKPTDVTDYEWSQK